MVRCYPVRIFTVEKETESNIVLQKLNSRVYHGWPESVRTWSRIYDLIGEYMTIISNVNDLLMAGSRIIILQVSQQQFLQEIHQGRPKANKCVPRENPSSLLARITQGDQKYGVSLWYLSGVRKCPTKMPHDCGRSTITTMAYCWGQICFNIKVDCTCL